MTVRPGPFRYQPHMELRVRLFAVLRDRVGDPWLTVTVPASPCVKDLLDAIAQAQPGLAPLLPSVRVAVNEDFASPDDPISASDEVALIPPVSGGNGGLFRVTEDELVTQRVEDAVRHEGAGAVVSFVGTVRDHTKEHGVEALEYEAYASMAEKQLRKIGAEVLEQHPTARVAIEHRIGRLVPGEASVAIAVSSPHRAVAFEGCRHVIERLKEDVPIWKREYRTGGAVWVGVGS